MEWTRINEQDEVEYWCTTTNQWYVPISTVIMSGVVWCECPLCDNHRRTGDDYDASNPQQHGYPLNANATPPEPTDEVRQISHLIAALEWTPI